MIECQPSTAPELGTPKGDQLMEVALRLFFERLSSRGVRHAILRNYESLPYSVGARDIDIVVMPEDLVTAIEVVRSVTRDLSCSLANHYRDERLVQFALFKRLGPEEFFELKLDYFTNSQVYGVECYSAEQMLRRVRKHNGLPVVAEEFVFLDKWLFHLVVGQPVSRKYDARFAAICRRRGDALVVLLSPVLGQAEAANLVAGVAVGQPYRMAPLPRLRRATILARMLRAGGLRGAWHVLRFLGYRLRNVLAPHGIFLSVSGPDGSGKTTVINAVMADLQRIYGGDSVVYRHFRPAVLPRIAELAKAAHALETVDEGYSDPHRSSPSGAIGSLGRLAYYLADYLVGYFALVRPRLVDRQIMVFDRYFHDVICDPGRSRIRLPTAVLRFAGTLLPRPRFAFFISVRAEVAHARKQELTLARIGDLNRRYLDLVARGMMRRVGNDESCQEAAAHIVDAIVGERDAKARRVLGWRRE